MSTPSTFITTVTKNTYRLMAIAVISFFSLTASATVIDFDELTLTNNAPDAAWYDNPLNPDEYLDQGVRIYNGWLEGTASNLHLIAGPGARIEFLNNLPTFFSMNVSSSYGDAVFLELYGESGYLSTITTSGWRGSEENYIPAIPNELISFNSDVAIKAINISSFYGMRIRAQIDNITFTNTPVPAPSSIAILCIGLLGLLLNRYRA